MIIVGRQAKIDDVVVGLETVEIEVDEALDAPDRVGKLVGLLVDKRWGDHLIFPNPARTRHQFDKRRLARPKVSN